MNKVYDNNGNELVIGMNEWDYVQKMIDEKDFYCTVNLENGSIKKVDVKGDVLLSLTTEKLNGQGYFLTDYEVTPVWNPYEVNLEEIKSLYFDEEIYYGDEPMSQQDWMKLILQKEPKTMEA